MKGLQKLLGIKKKIRTYQRKAIEQIYQQQFTMLKEKTHRIEDRIMSIHRSHLRSIVRGKSGEEVEFGSKCILSYVNGYAFLDGFGYEAYYEGEWVEWCLKLHEKRFGVKS